MPVSRVTRLCIFSGLGSLALILAGCAVSGDSIAGSKTPLAGSGSTLPAQAGLGGKVYGAQQPITGAAVTLWAAGTTGTYGAGAASVATTTTDSNGNFSFNNGGLSPCTTGQHLYITSVGGSPGAGINRYAALIAALPVPCGPATASTFVVVNEVTTAASVTALQQFMSIAPGGTPAWTIGAPAANATGLANAFVQVGNLVAIATGASGITTAANTIGGVTYTTTITPDTAKLYTLADVLAACINTNGSSTCTSLFADSTPASDTAPTDTIQAAYYLATNAAGLTMPAHGDPGSPSYLCNQYVGAQPPFPPGTACNVTAAATYPTDWTVDVNWKASNGAATVGTANVPSVAIDGSGNIWTAALTSSTTGLGVTEFNPAGQVQFTPATTASVVGGWNYSTCTTCGTAVSLGGTHTGDAIAIDTNGNAWATSWNGTTNTIASQIEAPVVKIAPGTGSASAYLVGYSPAGISIDGSNDLYIGDGASTSANRYYESELQAGAATGNLTLDSGTGRTTNGTYYSTSTIDDSGYVWPATSGGETTIPRIVNSPSYATASTVGSTTALPAAAYYLAADASGNAWASTTTTTAGATGLEYINVGGNAAASIASPTVTTYAIGANGSTQGGLYGPQGMAIDGTGNLWVVNANGTGSSSAGGGISEFVPSNNGTALTALSPSGTGVFGFFSNSAIGAPTGAAIDGSGNVWFKTRNGSSLYYLVGVASPVVTPISAMVQTGFLGERPGATMLASLSSALNFSTATTTSQSQTATLTNTGTAPVKFNGATIGGTNPSDFTITGNTCGASGAALAVGASCTLTVTFASSTAGTFSAALNVASNGVVSPSSATLTGMADTAVPFSVTAGSSSSPTPTSIAFPSMVAGGVSTGQALVVTNNGSVALSLATAMSGTGANLFNETTNCGTSLAAGSSCDIGLTFAPKVAGSYSASLTLTDNAGSGSQTVPVSGTATPFTIAVNTSSASAWVINNGAITFNWNSSSGNLVSWVLDGTSDQLVDTTTTSNGQPYGLYMDNSGSFDNEGVPSGGTAATGTVACTIVGGTVTGAATCATGTGSTPYFDWSLTIPDSANSGNDYTFVEHWIVFPNDPGVHTYVELVHSGSDAAGSVGQVQWVFRDNLSTFSNTYEVNSGLGILGVEDIPRPALSDTESTDPGRAVQNAAEDLHGFADIPGNFGRYFDTKYDYAGYEYLHQAQGTYGVASSGKTYGVWTVLPKLETLVGGPTKQDLYFTGNIDMIEAYSDHEDLPLNLNTAANVPYNRLFGPYYIHVNTPGPAYNQTGNTLVTTADMYADAISAGAAFASQYDNEAQLVAAGYVPSTARGSVSIQMNGVTGAQYTAWAVLSDPASNFQVSCNGLQYWADISSTGSYTFTGVAPGTYRLSVYVLGQWGEYRQDNIVVTANNTTTVPAAAWVPENFGAGTPVFTIGTPDRSSHEFLHGHNTATGNDDREYWGNWNYWSDFAANSGAVVYYATAVGSTPASNNLQLWNYDHWGSSFDPGLFAGVYNASDDTTDGYNYAIPAYVAALPGATGANGVTTPIPPWQVYFATPANFGSQTYVELSISAACAYGSYVVTLNGHQLIWHYTNYSDCMIRSGLSGYTQWFVMEFPVSDLNQTVGGSNEITVSMSQQYGAEDDAWRLELTNNTSNPASTGWHDYTYISGSTTTLNNDALPNP